jgi:predicted RNase H-like HicB family nuclease
MIVMSMKYTVILEKGRESGFVAHVPVLKSCVSQGDSRKEAISHIKEAIEAYAEALIEDGLPVPTEIGKETKERQGIHCHLAWRRSQP